MKSRLLKKAGFDYDAELPDGKREVGFTIEVGISGQPDWEVKLNELDNGKIRLQVKDSKVSTVVADSLYDCEVRLMKRIQTYGDMLDQTPEYKDKAPLTVVKMGKQLQSYFNTMS